mmetsp:Transcript_62973/g.203041  ORF Transcript_62973/g.203041 Transcript_62973/m.203041 type:complete len:452 (-) Transcript_62973:246-1601(-)
MVAGADDSGDVAGEEGEKERLMAQAEQNLVRVFSPSLFLTILSGGMLFSARQAVALPQFQDAASMTIFMSRLASAGAFFEFLMNPVFGKLADACGRRPVLPIANFAIIWARLLLFLQPNKKYPLIVEQAVTIPLVTSFFTIYRAALGDQLEGSAFARANATISMAAGAALVAGPMVAKTIMNRSEPKYCYLVSVLFSSASFMNLCVRFKETLPVEKRRPLVLSDMQPLGFLQLMKTRVMACLMLTTGMQTFTEGRNITNVISIYLLNDIKWNWNQINNYVSAYGVGLVLSGLTVKPMLQSLGLINFTTVSNTCNVLNLLCTALVPPLNMFFSTNFSMYLGVLFLASGGRKRDAAESLIMKMGNDEGFGNGFIAGCMMNFRAVVNVLAPLLFGSIYAWGSKRKSPSIVFLAGVLTVLLGEASLRSLRHKDLGLDEHGQLMKAPVGHGKAKQG